MGFDFDAALERMGGDRELLEEIANLFQEDAPQLLESIRVAIEAKDGQTLQRAAHALKGSVANFGADEAVAVAFQLEQMGREENLEGSKAAFVILEAEIQKVLDALMQMTKGDG